MIPYYDEDGITLYLGDCREVLPLLPPARLLLTDPPYGIPAGAAVVRRADTAVEDWGTAGHNELVPGWHERCQLEPDAWIVEFGLMAGNEFATAKAHASSGWAPSNVFALVKPAPAPTPRPGFASAVELAMVSKRGQPQWHGGGYTPNRWIGLTPNRTGKSWGHPTEKPAEPLNILVQALTGPDELVLDPFAGSGTTLRAAKDLGRRAIGVEIDEVYCDIIVRRLQQGVLPL